MKTKMKSLDLSLNEGDKFKEPSSGDLIVINRLHVTRNTLEIIRRSKNNHRVVMEEVKETQILSGLEIGTLVRIR